MVLLTFTADTCWQIYSNQAWNGMCRDERERAIIPFSDQFRPYYTMIDISQLRSLQISVDRVLRITRHSVDTAQAHRSWLNAKFSGFSIEAGRWHVPCNNGRRFSGLYVWEGALKSPSAIFSSAVFNIFFYVRLFGCGDNCLAVACSL